MKRIEAVRREVKKAYIRLKKQGGWRAVGEAFGVTGGMAFRIAEQGYEPKNPEIRVKLGLSAMVPAPACPECGEVHTTKRCTRRRRVVEGKRLFDLPVEVVRWMIENREEV